MQVQRVRGNNYSGYYIKNNHFDKVQSRKQPERQPSFKAVLLNDNLILKCGKNGEKTVKAALIELELDARELIADRRYRHRDLIPNALKGKIKENKEEIIKYLDSIIPTEDYYTGDIALLGYFANRYPGQFHGDNYAKSAMNNAMLRNQYPNMQYPNFITMKESWENTSNSIYNPNYTKNGKGLLRKELADYMTNSDNTEKVVGIFPVEDIPNRLFMHFNDSPIRYSSHVNADSLVYNDRGVNKYGTMRQRVLMLVEPSKDGQYRHLPPSTKIYGMAEIYTDRVADVLDDMLKERRQQNTKTANLVCQKFNIKHLKPTIITSYLAPLRADEGWHKNTISEGEQAGINRVLDIENSKDAAKTLIDAIEDKSKFAGVNLIANISVTSSRIIEFFEDLWSFNSFKKGSYHIDQQLTKNNKNSLYNW